ncbi:MAG: MarR family transcriptional regulator [Actinomycetota bacterium]|nr:MarR family transcriptional regulator [Actinomycetota bacterium]
MTDPASSDLGADLLAVVARLNRWATSRAALPVPFAQARLIGMIDLLGPARVSDLAAADHCSQPTMTNQLHRLADAGLVTRTPDPQDARAVLISLSDTGSAALLAARRARGAAIEPYVASLSKDKLKKLSDAVTALRLLMDELPMHPAPAERGVGPADALAGAEV